MGLLLLLQPLLVSCEAEGGNELPCWGLSGAESESCRACSRAATCCARWLTTASPSKFIHRRVTCKIGSASKQVCVCGAVCEWSDSGVVCADQALVPRLASLGVHASMLCEVRWRCVWYVCSHQVSVRVCAGASVSECVRPKKNKFAFPASPHAQSPDQRQEPVTSLESSLFHLFKAQNNIHS